MELLNLWIDAIRLSIDGETYTYYRTDDELQQRGLAGLIDYLFIHLSEFPNMTQQEFIDHLSADLDKRFGYEDYE